MAEHVRKRGVRTTPMARAMASKVVQERLRHRKIETTLNTYAHVLSGQQRAAARLLASVLHRS
jgi:hypothetical protein